MQIPWRREEEKRVKLWLQRIKATVKVRSPLPPQETACGPCWPPHLSGNKLIRSHFPAVRPWVSHESRPHGASTSSSVKREEFCLPCGLLGGPDEMKHAQSMVVPSASVCLMRSLCWVTWDMSPDLCESPFPHEEGKE